MINSIIDKLNSTGKLKREELSILLNNLGATERNYMHSLAAKCSEKHHGKIIKMRGLIEISNICKQNCFYCGIRKGNKNVERYRLNKSEILECCKLGAELGFQTFVLQGGEDPHHTKEWIEDVVKSIHTKYPDKTITLSLGERSANEYLAWFNAGARRYLLRHETINPSHYAKLHPENLKIESRINCLNILKEIGYETGTGIMVGSPFQTIDNIVDDLMFMQTFRPEMIGIGPFIHHHDTPFATMQNGDIELTLTLLSILRLMHPKANIPATTSLGTLATDGRERGILAGANVLMPNLSPQKDRKKYSLYDNKICTNEEAAEGLDLLNIKIKAIGYSLQ